ncbi:MAG: hypothetical protein C0412_05105 [Flavobacterium sp.]|nr:hypothetical protein [Flavobacterium sp.]
MKNYSVLFLLILIITFSLVIAQDKKVNESQNYNFVQYFFVNYTLGPTRNQPPDEAKKIQDGHMANFNKLIEDGKALCGGPFVDAKGGGMLILNVKTAEEAKKLCDNDPAVIAGRLAYEIRPWYTYKNVFFKNEK